MRVLVVNNDSDTWDELLDTARRADYEVTPVHCSTIGAIDPRGYDLAILSGGWWYDDEVELLQNYADELEFIKTTPIPILGICIGMQLMHVSLDQAVPLLDEAQSGYKDIVVTPEGQAIFGFSETMRAFKNHTRGVLEADPDFDVLAYSPSHIEIMMHRSRPLLGVQFHPESDTVEQSEKLLQTLVTALVGRDKT